MNEFDYECYQRKQLARQSRYKKNGSKSRKCSLPSDRMTNKQWKERCGPVETYNMNDPMSWVEFKNMPDRLQAEYITNLQNEYGVSAIDIAEMLGVSARSVRSHIATNNLNVKWKKGNCMTREKRTAWGLFISKNSIEVDNDDSLVDSNDDDEETTIISDEVVPEIDVVNQNNPNVENQIQVGVIDTQNENSPVGIPVDHGESRMKMSAVNLKFSGVIDCYAVAQRLHALLGNNASGELEIICNLS